MRLSGILASLIGLGEAQGIVTDQPADSGIIFDQAGETHQITYLDREFQDSDGEFQHFRAEMSAFFSQCRVHQHKHVHQALKTIPHRRKNHRQIRRRPP